MAKIKKAIWLSYDLGIGGDYPGFYKWLDNHKAIECGNSVAFIKYPIGKDQLDDLLKILSDDIKASVDLRSGDRIYVIYREVDGTSCSVKGNFISGRRKSNPWEGYGDSEPTSGEDGE